MTNLKIERLGQALIDELSRRIGVNAAVAAHDAGGDLYITVTRGVGDAALVKFEPEAVQASGSVDFLGLPQPIYTPHITKLGIDAGASGTQASDTATLLANLVAGDKLTVNTHDFTSVNSGAAGDQWNLVGTGASDVLTIGGGADTAFGAGKTITLDVGAGPVVLTEGLNFAAGADDQASATAIQNAINGNVALNTKVVAVAALGGAGVNSTVTVTAINLGVYGNAFTAATNDAVATWSSATFAPGALNLTASAANLAAAIAGSATSGVHNVVTATSALAVVTVKAVSVGVAGNAIPVTETGGHITVATATLSGGTNATAAGTSDVLRNLLIALCAPTGTALLIYEKAGIVESDLINGALLTNTIRNNPWGILAQV